MTPEDSVVHAAAGVAPVALREARIGKVRALGSGGARSGIDKQPIASVFVAVDGLRGDEQGDTRHHGGPEKALHHYAAEHYPRWREWLPTQAARFVPGGFGENLSTLGMSEETVCLGDVYRLGTATLQVSQGRQPCWKLELRFGVPGMARRVQESGLTGWYYRVLESGMVTVGDCFELQRRPHPEWPLARLHHVLYRDCLNREALAALAGLDALSGGWRELVARRLEQGVVEDWSRRLVLPS